MRHRGLLPSILALTLVPTAIQLGACGSSHPVVTWVAARISGEDRLEVRANGDITFTATTNGVEEKRETLKLTKEQVSELDDILRTQKACELASDPAYAPAADEGKTTLSISFSDQTCNVTLWNSEWHRGRAHDIAETMHSMRLRPH